MKDIVYTCTHCILLPYYSRKLFTFCLRYWLLLGDPYFSSSVELNLPFCYVQHLCFVCLARFASQYPLVCQDKGNGRVFREYAQNKGESVWAPFLTLLNRPDDISVNLTAWILARLACDGGRQMQGSDLQLYITWLKDQLRKLVSDRRSGHVDASGWKGLK